MSARRFAIVTKDYSGLGWVKKLTEDGERVYLVDGNEEDDEELYDAHECVGDGWFDKLSLEDAEKKLKDVYWIFAENSFTDVADRLRKAGRKVFGTSALAEKMEHDRNYAIKIANGAGLKSPATQKCQTAQEALAYVESSPDTAFVFKPDDGAFNYLTYVPASDDPREANEELCTFLRHVEQDPGSCVVQERVDGIEVNTEAWFYEGEPFFWFAGLESKRKNTGELGEMAGCAGDVAWKLDGTCALVDRTIAKLYDFYQSKRYTGFADVNVILTKQGPRFLEVCNRFGYNSHVTMFLALAKDGMGAILADYIDGRVTGMEDRFRDDCGGSVCVFSDHPKHGQALMIDPSVMKQFYPFDGFKEDGDLLLTGYSDEIGIVTARGSSPANALQKAMQPLVDQRITVPGYYYRTDIAETDHDNAIVSRYNALTQRGLL